MNLTWRYSAFVLIAVWVLVGCSQSESPTRETDATPDSAQPTTTFAESLTPTQLAVLDDVRKRGELTFAVRRGQDSYYVDSDGEVRGFDYHLALAFAEATGMPANFVVINDVAEFFADEDGFDPAVITDDSVVYQPRLFRQVDVLAGPLGVTPWRERLSLMVPKHPASVSIIGRNASQINTFEDLTDKVIAVRPGDFMHSLLIRIADENALDFTYLEHNQHSPLQLVIDGDADLVVDGAIFLAREVELVRQLDISPLRLSVVPVAWAVDRSDEDLFQLLSWFVGHSLSSRLYHEIWSREMNIDFDLYLAIAGDAF